MAAEIDPSACAVCGEPNACGLSQGKSECWCFSVKLEQDALTRIPAEKTKLACICARCALGAASSTSVEPG